MTSQALSRRQVLALAATSGAAVTGIGCRTTDAQNPPPGTTSGGAPSGGTTPSAPAVIPNHIPTTAVTADLPGDNEGALPAFFTYPNPPAAGIDGIPGEGLGDVEILYPTYSPLVPAMDKNEYWQAMNVAAGTTLKLQPTPSGGYAQRFQTLLAGGDLPEVVAIQGAIPRLPQVLSTVFTDLSPLIGGERVKPFPSLANLPSISWTSCVFADALYGIPQSRPVSGGPFMFYSTSVVDQLGVDTSPGSFDDYLALFQEATDVSSRRFGCSNPERMLIHVAMMLGAPNGWRQLDNGEFTHDVLAPETEEALAQTLKMIDAGVFPPDWYTLTYEQKRSAFTSGTCVFHPDGDAAWSLFEDQLDETVGIVIDPLFDGGGPAPHFGGGARQGMAAIRNDVPDERKVQLLRLLDWMSTPLGTKEHLLRKFGVEGVHFDWVDGSPERREPKGGEIMDVQYITDGPPVLGPGDEDIMRRRHEVYTQNAASLVLDQSIGRYSETWAEKQATLYRLQATAKLDILAGRKELSTWPDVVAQWKRDGGDQAAVEFAAS